MKDFSYITNSHPSYIENLYHDYLDNPEGVDQDMRRFFDGYDFAVGSTNVNGSKIGSGQTPSVDLVGDAGKLLKEFSVYQLILAYRRKGHLVAKTNPIRERKDRRANLDLKYFGLTDDDLKTDFAAGKFVGLKNATLGDIVEHLKKCYTGPVGVEYTYINDQVKLAWLEEEIERKFNQPLSIAQKKRILQKLDQGVMFEKFLHTKYIGQKRFSLEGGETTIAALDAMINTAAEFGVKEVVFGMAHRGRLNVLANILGKTYEQIFTEFEGKALPDTTMGSGDVKYHMGFRGEHLAENGLTVNLQLCPNPSHLEAVDPVVIGFARSKADVIYESNYDSILPVLIHGDASVAGQGIVYEVLQMSGLSGYYTGGTMHFVINNQIGFTTDFDDARTGDYSTSVASMVQAPVFHVNGDDPEAVVKCVQIATRFRQEFNTDVFVDMVCYRRHGHNEGDDPKCIVPPV